MARVWCVLRSKPSKEEFFWGQLLAHQIEVYYPSIRAKAFSPTAHKAKPYFPGHLFIHIDLQSLEASFLNTMPGSRGLVVFNDRPACVPDAMLAAIRYRVERINRTADEITANRPVIGNVPILEDAFAGHGTIFESCGSGAERVRILIKLLRDIQLQGFPRSIVGS